MALSLSTFPCLRQLCEVQRYGCQLVIIRQKHETKAKESGGERTGIVWLPDGTVGVTGTPARNCLSLDFLLDGKSKPLFI